MKLLFLDAETSPHVVDAWGLFQQNIGLSQIQRPSAMLCYSAIWYDQPKKVIFEATWKDHPGMLARLHALLSEADVVAHYNGKRFDIPVMNRELIMAGYQPPSPYKQIDLLTTARKQFKFASNKLAFVAKALGIGEKLKHSGHELWTDVLAGDPKAQRLMQRYCEMDSRLLVDLYNKLKPWIKNGPNIGLLDGLEHACPSCGSEEVQRRGWANTTSLRYQRWHCQECGAWSRSAATERPTRRNSLTGIGA